LIIKLVSRTPTARLTPLFDFDFSSDSCQEARGPINAGYKIVSSLSADRKLRLRHSQLPICNAVHVPSCIHLPLSYGSPFSFRSAARNNSRYFPDFSHKLRNSESSRRRRFCNDELSLELPKLHEAHDGCVVFSHLRPTMSIKALRL